MLGIVEAFVGRAPLDWLLGPFLLPKWRVHQVVFLFEIGPKPLASKKDQLQGGLKNCYEVGGCATK